MFEAGGNVYLNSHFGASGGGVLDPSDDTWHPFPPGPDGDWGGDMAGMLDDDRLTMEYAHGWVLDVASADWIEVPERPSDALAYDFSHTTVGRSLFTFGGQQWPDDGTGDGELLSDAWQWTPPT